MYHWRSVLDATPGPVDLAFTDRHGGSSAAPYDGLNLAIAGDDDLDVCAANLRLVVDDFAPGARVADMHQVHGNTVRSVGAGTPDRPEADALVTTEPDTVLVVRVADCLPVLLVDAGAGVVGVAHAGRAGLLAGVVPAAVTRMRDLGATMIGAWLGPRVCGGCYEVPADLQAEVGDSVPAAVATTTWGTPSLDIGAGVRAQLTELEVAVHDLATCTRESADLYSYRRDGAGAGRFAGLVRRRAGG